jgi:hypothetical protein
MSRGMIKKTALVLVVLVLALFVGGCTDSGNGTTSSSTTPMGFPCSQWSGYQGCFYFMSNGSAVACQIDTNTGDLCTNTNGNFYSYYERTTVLCEEQQCVSYIPCSLRVTYDNLVNDGLAWQVVNHQQDQNATRSPSTITFTSTSATTVSTSVSASASIDISVNADALFATIFASVHAQINASVTTTATTVVGNAVKVTTPAGGTANGIYGVSVQVTSGHLYQSSSCGAAGGENNYGTVQTYVPIAPGWCVWISGETPCRIVSGK